MALRCGNQIDQSFLVFVLKLFEDDIARSGSGSTFQSINRSDLLNLLIPLPPLSEQRRVAARLDEQMAHVARARAAAQAQLATIDAMPAALLRQAFKGAG